MAVELRRGGLRLRADEVVGGIERITISSRLTRLQRFHAACYLVGDVLVDSTFVKAAPLLVDFLRGRPLAAVALTHHHEDHSGACGLLAEQFSCPVYLVEPGRQMEEGLAKMAFYRRLWWGRPAPYRPAPMPGTIKAGDFALRCLPTPGHSVTHCAFFAAAAGVLFSGDLYITGGATAVMSHENPYLLLESLRKLARLEPRLLLNGHGLLLEDPAAELLAKAEAIETVAARVLELDRKGLDVRRIAGAVFKREGRLRDRILARFTAGEFSRENFVRACLAHRPRS